MATKIKHKRSSVPGKKPIVSQLESGELAINTYDGKMFFKKYQEYLNDDNEPVVEETIAEFTASVSVRHKLYIQQDGNDRNDGTKWDSAFKTFERALEVATERDELTVIEVGPGTYYTFGHLDVPDNCILKAIHRTVFIKPVPGFEERNVFRLGSGCFLEGFVFEGWRLDDMDDPKEGFAVAFRPGALITRVPYVHKVVVRTPPFWGGVAPPLDRNNANPLVGRGAGVVLADASVLDPDSIYPNIMTWGATPVTHNGIGYCAKNGGLINAVNAISLWCHRHFYALAGGQIILSSCSTQFGDYTMVATGSRKIISPTEASVALTAQATAANVVDLNKTTIIDNMWSQLVSEGYTSTWPADYEATTKRDAGLFLQALSWTLQTANEKPMLDFAKGFFDTNSNRTFEAAPYNFDKSLRDPLLINDAVAYDVLFNSNFRSIKAARSFYRASASNLLAEFKPEVLMSLTRQKATLGSYLSGTSLTRSNALFDEIIDIITNGEAAANAYVLTDPTGYDTGFFNARRLVTANIEFIKDEIIAWINTQIDASISPFDDIEYDEALCRRDIGLVIDAVLYDMVFGSNYRSIVAGRSYLRGQAINVTGDQYFATVNALNYLKTKLLELVASNATATASIGSNMDLIVSIIANGQTAIPAYVIPNPTNIAVGFQNAVVSIEENRDFIKAEVIQHIRNTFPYLVYNVNTCRRDIDYILDSVKYDLTYGGNLETLVAAKSYYDNVLLKSVLPANQKSASVSAYNFLKNLLYQVATSTVTTTLQNIVPFVPADTGSEGSIAAGTAALNLVDIIADYLDTDVLAATVTPSLTWVNSALVTQFNNVVAQKTATTDNVITQINNFYLSFAYNVEACNKDVQFILEALTYDLTYGGNLETYNAATSYYVDGRYVVSYRQQAAKIAAITRLKSIIDDIVQGIAITPSTGNTTSQDISGTPGSVAAALFSQARMDDLLYIFNFNGSPPPKILPNNEWPTAEFRTSFSTINTNTRVIARDVAKYTAVESGTLIGAFIYSWEYMRDQVKALTGVDATSDAIVDGLISALVTTMVDPNKVDEPSTITAIGHTWTGIMAGVALTKIPPARNETTIEESILELNNGVVIASGQDDQGSALFIGGMKIDADTGELTGPPFEQSVNRIATRTAIARSF